MTVSCTLCSCSLVAWLVDGEHGARAHCERQLQYCTCLQHHSMLLPCPSAAPQESSFSCLPLVELKNHEEQLQEDPAAQLSKVRQGRGRQQTGSHWLTLAAACARACGITNVARQFKRSVWLHSLGWGCDLCCKDYG